MRALILLLCLYSFQLCAQQKTYNITTFGAKGDGRTNNTTAIQEAIDKATAAGGGTVLIPAGKFVTGVITLKSNVTLHLAANGVLAGSTSRADYGPSSKVSALIVAKNAQHIGITGKGMIDGQGELLLKDIYESLKKGTLKDKEWQHYNEWGQMRPEEENRPKLIEFKDCQHITVKNVTIQNGLCWVQNYVGCSEMVFDSIKVVSNTFLNNDGIDLVDCKNVKLTNSSFDVADDGICFKSHDSTSYCDNIYVSDCKVRSSASGVKFGTASFGGFKNITVKNIYVYNTFRSAIAIETVDGGIVENINISNITAKNTGNAIFLRLGKRRASREPGTLSKVRISNVKAEIPATKPDAGYNMEGPRELFEHNTFPSGIYGIPGYPVSDVTLENIEITYTLKSRMAVANMNVDSLHRIPEAIRDYPEFSMFRELPAWGFYVRHATGITFKNVKLNYTGEEFRTACIFDDVKGLKLEKVKIGKTASTPLVILNNVTESSIDDPSLTK
jgi:hypothetical protein